MSKRLTDSQKRAIDAKFDWSEALCIGGQHTGKMLPKREQRKHYAGDHDPRISDMSELAHRHGCRVEFVLIPLTVDEWEAKRALERARKRICGKPKGKP